MCLFRITITCLSSGRSYITTNMTVLSYILLFFSLPAHKFYLRFTFFLSLLTSCHINLSHLLLFSLHLSLHSDTLFLPLSFFISVPFPPFFLFNLIWAFCFPSLYVLSISETSLSLAPSAVIHQPVLVHLSCS